MTAYQNMAGLLRNLDYEARAEPRYTPRGAPRPVPAIITRAPPVVLGYALAITAEEPEAHLPQQSARAGRAPPGQPGHPQTAWWAETQ
ncbi:MAG: hypothetical protein AAF762_07100 [Pseudomonadota bacterium]